MGLKNPGPIDTMNDMGSVQAEPLLKYQRLSICSIFIHGHSREKKSNFITLQPSTTLAILYYITCQLCGSACKHANIKINELQSFPSLQNKTSHNQKNPNHKKKKKGKKNKPKNNPQMHLKTQPEGSGSLVKLEGSSAAPRIQSLKTKRKMVFQG